MNVSNQRVLVTGAAGFIGSSLVTELLARGATVCGLDNFDPFYQERIKRANIASHLSDPAYRLRVVDLCDPLGVEQVFAEAKPEIVIHLAARAGVRPSLRDPVGYVRTNVLGTQHVIDSAVKAGVSRLVFASSSSVYGANSTVPFTETDSILAPISPYAATKIAGEALCASASASAGLPIVALRFFSVYGPRQRPDLAIHKFARLITAGKPVPFFGDGSMARDYTYIDDIVDGILRAVATNRVLTEPIPYRVYNLGNDAPVRLDQLVALLEEILGVSATLAREPAPLGDVQRTWADLARVTGELGYRPSTPIRTGLNKFAEWLRADIAATA